MVTVLELLRRTEGIEKDTLSVVRRLLRTTREQVLDCEAICVTVICSQE